MIFLNSKQINLLELLDDMRSPFDGLALEISLVVPLDHVPNISGDIPSLTGWEKESTLIETPLKHDQLGPSELTKEMEEIPPHAEYESPPRRVAEPIGKVQMKEGSATKQVQIHKHVKCK